MKPKYNPFDLSTPIPNGYEVTNVNTHSMKNTEQQLREEWRKTDISKEYKPFEDAVADFWLSKRREELEEIWGGVEKMKHEITDNDARRNRNAIYRNRAFDDVISFLQQRIGNVTQE